MSKLCPICRERPRESGLRGTYAFCKWCADDYDKKASLKGITEKMLWAARRSWLFAQRRQRRLSGR